MTIKLFWKNNCPKCPAAKSLVAELDNVKYYDVDEVEGLAEAAFYGVQSTPSIVICDENGALVAAWLGEVPSKADVETCLTG